MQLESQVALRVNSPMKIESPGSWEAVAMTKGDGFWVQNNDADVGFDDDMVVAQVDGNRPNDARLLAAAPDLYAALQRMLGPAGYTDDNSITRQAKAALAKARCEPQAAAKT
jgi:hypothetical protein